MNLYWTSRKPINGLRHFVLVNKLRQKDQNNFLLVSVIDDEIFIEISNDELMNKENWVLGWIFLPKNQSITKDYLKYKLSKKNKKVINKIFVYENSVFNIS